MTEVLESVNLCHVFVYHDLLKKSASLGRLTPLHIAANSVV